MLPKLFTHFQWDALADIHGKSHNFLLNPPQGSLTGRSLGDCTTIILLWCHLHFTSHGSRLAWGGAGTPVPCMTDAYTQGNTKL